MNAKELQDLLNKRAAAMQYLDASNEGVEEVNDEHVIAMKAVDDLELKLECLLKSLPRNSTVNKMLVQEALATLHGVKTNVQSLRKKERKGNEPCIPRGTLANSSSG